jgi:hypothetical protein
MILALAFLDFNWFLLIILKDSDRNLIRRDRITKISGNFLILL